MPHKLLAVAYENEINRMLDQVSSLQDVFSHSNTREITRLLDQALPFVLQDDQDYLAINFTQKLLATALLNKPERSTLARYIKALKPVMSRPVSDLLRSVFSDTALSIIDATPATGQDYINGLLDLPVHTAQSLERMRTLVNQHHNNQFDRYLVDYCRTILHQQGPTPVLLQLLSAVPEPTLTAVKDAHLLPDLEARIHAVPAPSASTLKEGDILLIARAIISGTTLSSGTGILTSLPTTIVRSFPDNLSDNASKTIRERLDKLDLIITTPPSPVIRDFLFNLRVSNAAQAASAQRKWNILNPKNRHRNRAIQDNNVANIQHLLHFARQHDIDRETLLDSLSKPGMKRPVHDWLRTVLTATSSPTMTADFKLIQDLHNLTPPLATVINNSLLDQLENLDTGFPTEENQQQLTVETLKLALQSPELADHYAEALHDTITGCLQKSVSLPDYLKADLLLEYATTAADYPTGYASDLIEKVLTTDGAFDPHHVARTIRVLTACARSDRDAITGMLLAHSPRLVSVDQPDTAAAVAILLANGLANPTIDPDNKAALLAPFSHHPLLSETVAMLRFAYTSDKESDATTQGFFNTLKKEINDTLFWAHQFSISDKHGGLAEGWTNDTALKYLNDYAHRFQAYGAALHSPGQPDRDALCERLNATQAVMNAATALGPAVIALKPGESLMLPGGWVARFRGGHAIAYEFTREDDSHFSVRLFNTGGGIDWQHDYKGSGRKYDTAYEISHIPQDDLTATVLHTIETLSGARFKSPLDLTRQLYAFGDTLDKSQARQVRHPHFSQARQKVGNCAWKSLKSWTKFNFTPIYPEFKRFLDTSILYHNAKQQHGPNFDAGAWQLQQKLESTFAHRFIRCATA